MYDTAIGPDNRRSALVADAADHGGVSVPGMIAAVIWVVCLVAGLAALAGGHDAVAAVALAFAVMSPWAGLVWMSRAQAVGRRAERHEAPSAFAH